MRHVLLSNDDGVQAPGLRTLATAFLSAGWRVTVAAPDGERSAAAHSITIKQPLVAVQTTYEGVPQGAPLVVWAISGTPADCVKTALHELCDGKPDIVVSGVNNGWNVGTDVHYSGTVGAAFEGAFEGYPAIAVSVMHPDADRYRNAAEVAAQCAARLLGKPLPSACILNLNLPDCAPESVKGLVEAPITQIRYTDAYDRVERQSGHIALWLKGDIIKEGCTPGGDLAMLLEEYATLTALTWDLGLPNACGGYLQD